MRCDVFRSVDESAEHDWTVAVFLEGLNELDRFLQFRIFRASQPFSLTGKSLTSSLAKSSILPKSDLYSLVNE